MSRDTIRMQSYRPNKHSKGKQLRFPNHGKGGKNGGRSSYNKKDAQSKIKVAQGLKQQTRGCKLVLDSVAFYQKTSFNTAPIGFIIFYVTLVALMLFIAKAALWVKN